jgi:hypothetical protein
LAGIVDLGEHYRKYPREKVDGAVTAFAASLAALGKRQAPNVAVAAWGGNVYGLILPAGIQMQEWQRELATSHVFQVDGLPRTLRIAARLEVVERSRGEAPAGFFERLSKAAGAVGKA